MSDSSITILPERSRIDDMGVSTTEELNTPLRFSETPEVVSAHLERSLPRSASCFVSSGWERAAQEHSEAISTSAVFEWPETHEFDGFAASEAVEFCNSRGLLRVLRSIRSNVGKRFSNVLSVRAELDRFQEDGTEDAGHIVIRLTVGSDQAATMRAYAAFVEWMVETFQPEEGSYFTIAIHRRRS